MDLNINGWLGYFSSFGSDIDFNCAGSGSFLYHFPVILMWTGLERSSRCVSLHNQSWIVTTDLLFLSLRLRNWHICLSPFLTYYLFGNLTGRAHNPVLWELEDHSLSTYCSHQITCKQTRYYTLYFCSKKLLPTGLLLAWDLYRDQVQDNTRRWRVVE